MGGSIVISRHVRLGSHHRLLLHHGRLRSSGVAHGHLGVEPIVGRRLEDRGIFDIGHEWDKGICGWRDCGHSCGLEWRGILERILAILNHKSVGLRTHTTGKGALFLRG